MTVVDETTRTSPAVLITIAEGGIDYITCGDMKVVVLDFDEMSLKNIDKYMPIDVEDRIKDVEALPDEITWKADIIRRLQEFLVEVEAHVFS
jgi:hypothetical protein